MRHISSLIEAREASSVPVWRQQENGPGAKYPEAECFFPRYASALLTESGSYRAINRKYLRIVFPLSF
jgi:hypothetical protein